MIVEKGACSLCVGWFGHQLLGQLELRLFGMMLGDTEYHCIL